MNHNNWTEVYVQIEVLTCVRQLQLSIIVPLWKSNSFTRTFNYYSYHEQASTMPKYNSVKLLPATLVYVPLSALQLVYTCIPNVEECRHTHANVNKDNQTSPKAPIFAHLVIMCRRMSKLQLEYTCIYTYNLI